MAIQQSFTTSHGIALPKAYWRIYKIEYNVLRGTSTIVYAQIFKDVNARNSNLQPVDTVQFNFSLDVSNRGAEPVTQAYNSLKTKTKLKDNRGNDLTVDLSRATDV